MTNWAPLIIFVNYLSSTLFRWEMLLYFSHTTWFNKSYFHSFGFVHMHDRLSYTTVYSAHSMDSLLQPYFKTKLKFHHIEFTIPSVAYTINFLVHKFMSHSMDAFNLQSIQHDMNTSVHQINRFGLEKLSIVTTVLCTELPIYLKLCFIAYVNFF